MGGHRFAPTFVVLPEGTVWGYADADLVSRVVHRAGDFADVAGQYRGCPGLDSPQLQALEAEVARRVGWSLLDRQRTGSFDGINAVLTWQEDGQTITWEGEVRPGRHPSLARMHGAAVCQRQERDGMGRPGHQPLAVIVGSLDSHALRAAATWALAGLRPCRKRAAPVGRAEAAGSGWRAGIVSPCADMQASNASTAVFF